MDAGDDIRTFIAIELPTSLRDHLDALLRQLKRKRDNDIKWVDAANIHLTLKFLGSVKSELIAEISAVMAHAAAGSVPVDMHLAATGAFPNLTRPQVAWVGLGGETEALNQLLKTLESGLEPLGFAPERRPFRAHLTLARLKDRAGPATRSSLGERLRAVATDRCDFRVDGVALIRSRLSPEGPHYSQLAVAPLSPLSTS